ncbi:MAG: DUF5060 domain-containing protein [Spirochaetes bacterium]|nr:DUF5060 domain-containing protein [Spirochaetota bacterium]
MKAIRLIFLIVIFLFRAVSGYSYIWEGFERENMWLITAMEDNAVRSMKISSTYTSEEEKALELEINKTSWSKKGFISREGFFDLSMVKTIQMDILCEERINLSMGFSTGPGNEWFESKNIQLKKGWNRDIIFNLQEETWKSQESLWENTIKPENMNDVRKITFVFIKGEKTKVYLDNICFTGQEVLNDAYVIPYEPVLKDNTRSAYNILKRLSIASFAKDNSGKVIKEEDNRYSLSYINVDNMNKACHSIEEDLNWNDSSKLIVKVKNPSKRYLSMALAFQVGNGWVWYESPQYLLRPKKSTEFILNLNAPYFKSEATDWKYNTHLYNKDMIKVANLLVYGMKGRKSTGKVTIEKFDLVKGKVFLPKRKIVAPTYLEKPDKSLYKKPKVEKVLKTPAEVKMYDKYEATFYLKNTYQNPYNPEEVTCVVLFKGPDDKEVKVPAFYYEDPDEGKKEPNPLGQTWKIRFAPFKEGKWEYKIRVKNLQGETVYDSKRLQFKCLPSENRGFVMTKGNRFIFQDGSAFYPFGLSLGWVTPQDKNSYLDYFEKFSKAGMNWTRMWNIPWGLTIEWIKPRREGLGRYSQKDSKEWDKIIEYARAKKIYIQFCINNYRDIADGYNWEQNPYCFYNGGPIQEPKDFFTDTIAKKYFKRKLLYMVARWGYASSIMCWELFNEVDLGTGHNKEEVMAWHKEMAAYLKSIDPYRHLVATSYSRRMAGGETYDLEEIDFSQTHVYTEDFRQALFSIPFTKMKEFNKPHLTGEIGGSVEMASAEAKDKTGIRIHDVIWYSFFSGAPTSALYWWWDEYIEKNNLYYHFENFSELTSDVDYNNRERIQVKVETDSIGDYFFAPVVDWEKATGEKYQMEDNEMIGDGLLSKFMQGSWQKAWMVEPEFTLNFLKDGKFKMFVEMASYVGAGFSFYVDNKKVFSKKFPEIKSKKPNQVDKVFTADIPSGKHTIRIISTEMDWFKIKWFRFTNCVPDVEAMGIKSKDKIYVRLKNRDFDIEKVLDKKKINPSKPGKIEVKNSLGEGRYKALFYDTWTGEQILQKSLDVQDDRIQVDYPEIKKDILIIIGRE